VVTLSLSTSVVGVYFDISLPQLLAFDTKTKKMIWGIPIKSEIFEELGYPSWKTQGSCLYLSGENVVFEFPRKKLKFILDLKTGNLISKEMNP